MNTNYSATFVKCPGCGRQVMKYSTWTSNPSLPAFCLECLTDGKTAKISLGDSQ